MGGNLHFGFPPKLFHGVDFADFLRGEFPFTCKKNLRESCEGGGRGWSAEHLLVDLWLIMAEGLAATPLAARLSAELCAEVFLWHFVLGCSDLIPCFPETFQAYDGSSDVSELGKFCSWEKLKLLKIFQPSLRNTDTFRLFFGGNVVQWKLYWLLWIAVHWHASSPGVRAVLCIVLCPFPVLPTMKSGSLCKKPVL